MSYFSDYGYSGYNKSSKGIQNVGNTCYLNAVLQVLLNSPNFRDLAQNCSINSLAWKIGNLKREKGAIKKLVLDMEKLLGKDLRQQSDSGSIWDQIVTVMKQEKVEEHVMTDFKFETSSISKCLKCKKYNVDKGNAAYQILLPLGEKSVLQFVKSLTEGKETSIPEYYCDFSDSCKAAPTKGCEIEQLADLPDICTFRIEHSQTMANFVSLDDAFTYKNKRYELSAVVQHMGQSLYAGHYVAYLRGKKGWTQFNDSFVNDYSAPKLKATTSERPVLVYYSCIPFAYVDDEQDSTYNSPYTAPTYYTTTQQQSSPKTSLKLQSLAEISAADESREISSKMKNNYATVQSNMHLLKQAFDKCEKQNAEIEKQNRLLAERVNNLQLELASSTETINNSETIKKLLGKTIKGLVSNKLEKVVAELRQDPEAAAKLIKGIVIDSILASANFSSQLEGKYTSEKFNQSISMTLHEFAKQDCAPQLTEKEKRIEELEREVQELKGKIKKIEREQGSMRTHTQLFSVIDASTYVNLVPTQKFTKGCEPAHSTSSPEPKNETSMVDKLVVLPSQTTYVAEQTSQPQQQTAEEAIIPNSVKESIPPAVQEDCNDVAMNNTQSTATHEATTALEQVGSSLFISASVGEAPIPTESNQQKDDPMEVCEDHQ